jgi:hypothetical protein
MASILANNPTMKRCIISRLARVLGCGAAFVLTAAGQSDPLNLAVASKTAYEDRLKQVKTLHDGQRAVIFEKYIGAVERLKAGFQSQGDLPNALLAEEDIKAAKALLTTDKVFPGVERLRPILLTELGKIQAAENEGFALAAREHVARLEQAKIELTKAGKLQEALAVEREIKDLIQAATPAVAAPAAVTSGTPAPAVPARPALGAREPSARGLEIQRYGQQAAQADESGYTGYVFYKDFVNPIGKPRVIRTLEDWKKEEMENVTITGFIKIEAAGTYQFRTNSDYDRNELIIDDKIVCKFRDGEKAGATVELRAGLLPIVWAAYSKSTVDGTVEWIVPGETAWKPIPSGLFFH